MKNQTKSLSSDSGQVIMFIIFVVLFLVLFVSLFLSRNLLKQTKVATGVASSVQAYYIADSGTENVLYYLSENPTYMPKDHLGGNIPISNLFAAQGGTSMAVVSNVSGDEWKIDIVGTYKTTSRAIQLFS